MATIINAGRVAMVPKGEWSSATAYTRLDVVLYNGSSWVSIADSTGQVPSEDSTYWQLLSLKGEQGEKGDKGDTGATGATGTKGDKGDTGAIGATGATGPQGPQGEKGDKGDKGDQGNSGYTGAAGELEVVNNLTDGGATAALSAEMGKVLRLSINPKVNTKLESFKAPTATPNTDQYIAAASQYLQNNFGVSKMVTTSKYATKSTFSVVVAKTATKPSLLQIPSGNKYVFVSFIVRTKGNIETITASDIAYNSSGSLISGAITNRQTSFEPFEGHDDTYKVYVRYTLSETAQAQAIQLYQGVTINFSGLTSDYSGFQSAYFRVWWGNDDSVVWDWDVPFWFDKLVNTVDVVRLNTNRFAAGSGDTLYNIIDIAPQDIQDNFKVRYINTINRSVTHTTSTDIKIIPCTSKFASGSGKFTLPSWAKVVYASCLVRTKHNLAGLTPNTNHYTTSGTLETNYIASSLTKLEPHPLYEDVYKLTVKWLISDNAIDDFVFFPFVTARLSSTDDSFYNGFQSFFFRLWYSATDEYDFEWDNMIDLNRSYLTTNPFTQTFRKICLYGTSIEATNYFDSVASAFGLKKGDTYLNYGNGGGGITWNPSNANFSDTTVKKAFSCTLAEKQAELTSRGIDPSTVPAADLNTSYDVSVLGNLDADLYIFGTYGINDRDISGWDSENSEFDRATIYGAYNYVIDKLLEAKPNAKIIILGQHCFAWSGTVKVNDIQADVARHWNIPFLDMGHNLMFNSRTFSLYTTDGCHPNSAGRSVIADFVRDWLISHTNNRTK